jgi:hypothetical protein
VRETEITHACGKISSRAMVATHHPREVRGAREDDELVARSQVDGQELEVGLHVRLTARGEEDACARPSQLEHNSARAARLRHKVPQTTATNTSPA